MVSLSNLKFLISNIFKIIRKQINFLFAGKLPPDQVRHEQGRLHYVFIGDPYNDTDFYTANIKMSCDFSSLDDTFLPEIFPLVIMNKLIIKKKRV